MGFQRACVPHKLHSCLFMLAQPGMWWLMLHWRFIIASCFFFTELLLTQMVPIPHVCSWWLCPALLCPVFLQKHPTFPVCHDHFWNLVLFPSIATALPSTIGGVIHNFTESATCVTICSTAEKFWWYWTNRCLIPLIKLCVSTLTPENCSCAQLHNQFCSCPLVLTLSKCYKGQIDTKIS